MQPGDCGSLWKILNLPNQQVQAFTYKRWAEPEEGLLV
jgi:hypothetical protein